MKIYYECELCEDASGWSAVLPKGFGKAVHASSREKVALRAAAIMKAGVMRRLLQGEPIPQPERLNAPSREGGMLLAVVADVDPEGFRVTASEAADILGLSSARVTQLLDAGKLAGYREGRDSYVALSSVRRRLEGAGNHSGAEAQEDV